MKRNLIITLSIMLLAAAGCRKDSIQSVANEKDNNTVTAKAESSGGCRMTLYDYYNSLGDFHQIVNFAYKNGLVDECVAFGVNYKMEYENRKLKISRGYDGETLLFTIHFVYEINKVVKEIWYDGGTQNVIDEVNNTYNQRGQMIRNESINFDYYVTYTYYVDGGLQSWHFFVGGHPSQTAEYTYNAQYKNPFRSTSGVEYSFFYANSGFGAGTGKQWYSSEKVTLYDEQGNPFVYYEQDPERTVWHPAQQNYPLQVDYVDKWSQLPIINTFEYENCIPGQEQKALRIPQKNTDKNNRLSLLAKPILNGLSHSAIQDLRKSKMIINKN